MTFELSPGMAASLLALIYQHKGTPALTSIGQRHLEEFEAMLTATERSEFGGEVSVAMTLVVATHEPDSDMLGL